MIKVGDKITLHYDFDGWPSCVRQGVVLRVAANETFEYETTDGTGGVRSLLDENLDWIRGHHKPDSPEVQAMRAAWAL